ncbi:MAG: amino-acid N-acetyltransferase [Burkholderiaceae bacterium]|jgi:amino-acid N-acetyltransferase|nr:amino-acid N-acetyltransferase [Burkholderiaceae bacterium]
METLPQFVSWLRSVAPYVHAFRGKTFVIAFPGELVMEGILTTLAHDVSLLHALGIHIVLVHGFRPQVEEQIALRKRESQFYKGTRVTDAVALECAKEAVGEIRLDIEGAFSQGLPNTPMAHAEIRIISGNFVTATPLGIIDGVDMQLTGKTRTVAYESIHAILASGDLVLISPLGFSRTGEVFNLRMEDVALSTALAIHAHKLVFLTETPLVPDEGGEDIHEMTTVQAKKIIASKRLPDNAERYLRAAAEACLGGVARAHIVPYATDGAILLEIFTHDGVGTLITNENIDILREATISDIGSILQLIEPYEENGTLVKRGRELLEREIDNFSVLEHDGVIFGCAALYPFPDEKMAEMACLIVAPDVQGEGEGERILLHIENRARAKGFSHLFILTTQTAHWFLRRGFVYGSVRDLPQNRQLIYNWQRRSQVLIKKL